VDRLLRPKERSTKSHELTGIETEKDSPVFTRSLSRGVNERFQNEPLPSSPGFLPAKPIHENQLTVLTVGFLALESSHQVPLFKVDMAD
jgi:hypothetical protein